MSAPVPVPSGTVVFLFTDIEGSTVRWERFPSEMRAAVALHDQVMRSAVEAHGGYVFKTLGDAFCVAFATPVGALEAAIEAQRGLAQADFSAVEGIAVRMALHAGPVELRGDDYLGPAVIRVGRLLSAAHGSQIIVSRVVQEALRDNLPEELTLIDLGPHWLRELSVPEEIHQVVAPGLRTEFAPLRTLVQKPNNLPQPMTSFIGREAELTEIKGLLERNRLVTLVGSGGLGKTRISMRVGTDLLSSFKDGVWLLELAPLTDGQLVAEQMAALFSLRVPGNRTATETFVDYLKDKNLLLILDNCEHLVADSAKLAANLLRNCPGVRLLASSREGLAVAGEHVYRMPSLSFPTRTEGITAENAMTYGAIRLFVERAQAAVATFELTDDTASAVAEICRRLDGIALAIELAAPRIRMLHPKALLTRLTDRFRLLTGGDRTALPRQQTLRALIDWSYVLLPIEEQVLLMRLSVFGGSWTIDAATEVTVGGPIEDWAIFDLVASLVDKSLVMPMQDGGAESRYRLLESTREYALEKLIQRGETDRRRMLAEYLLRRFEKADLEWLTMPVEPWLENYEPDLENLRAALEWCFGPEGDPVLGASIIARSLQLFRELSLTPEQRRWMETAIAGSAMKPLAPEIEGLLLIDALGFANFGSGRSEDTAKRTVELLRASGNQIGLAKALMKLGASMARPGDSEEAETHLREAEKILRARPATKELANALGILSAVVKFRGDTAAAMLLAEESLAVARRLGHRSGVELLASYVAEYEFTRGDLAAAIARGREAAASCRRSGNRRTLAYVLVNLGGYLLAGENIAEARVMAAEAIRLTRSLGLEREPLIWALEHLALIASLNGEHALAASLVGYGSAWYRTEQKVRDTTEQATYQRVSDLLAAALAPEERERLEGIGGEWTEDQAVAAAMSVAGEESIAA